MLECVSLGAMKMSRRIIEMSNDVEKSLGSELQHSKFSIQLDESTFGSSNILMAYVRYNSLSLECIIHEFLFAKYLTAVSRDDAILRCLEDYLNKLNVPMENITAVATDVATAMIGLYRGLTSLLKGKVPSVRTIHCVLRGNHLVAKNLSSDLHAALKVCIMSVNNIKVQPLSSRLFPSFSE